MKPKPRKVKKRCVYYQKSVGCVGACGYPRLDKCNGLDTTLICYESAKLPKVHSAMIPEVVKDIEDYVSRQLDYKTLWHKLKEWSRLRSDHILFEEIYQLEKEG